MTEHQASRAEVPPDAKALVAAIVEQANKGLPYNGFATIRDYATRLAVLLAEQDAAVEAVRTALTIAEAAMDKLNGDTGTKSRPCSFCRAMEYDAEVGIVHEYDCPILIARAVLARVKGEA